MPTLRRQLTLFVPEERAVALEAVRRVVDPIQHALIAAHVTLCREDELTDFSTERLLEHLRSGAPGGVTLGFGAPEVFAGHGILLPAMEGEEHFRALRAWVLGSEQLRRQPPHLTLAHPRNPKSPGNSLTAAAHLSHLPPIRFETLSLIEQVDSTPWRVLFEVRLGGGK